MLQILGVYASCYLGVESGPHRFLYMSAIPHRTPKAVTIYKGVWWASRDKSL